MTFERERAVPGVLIVDDERLVVEFFREMLAEAGFRVSAVSSGAAALSAVPLGGHDLVLLDRGLVEPAAAEVVSRMRAARPGLRVVVLAASGGPATILTLLRAGASDFIHLGASSSDWLVRRLRQVIGEEAPPPGAYDDVDVESLPADPLEAAAALRTLRVATATTR